jgi:hypothetical protein
LLKCGFELAAHAALLPLPERVDPIMMTLKFVLSSLIFLGAFLVFQIQPMTGKALLPAFGSAPDVWTTCLLFFQLTLLVGYGYAHVLRQYFDLANQWKLHLLLIGLQQSAVSSQQSAVSSQQSAVSKSVSGEK